MIVLNTNVLSELMRERPDASVLAWVSSQDSTASFATVVAGRESSGRPIGYPDAQIAGICLSRGATLATRNVKDFADLSLSLLNPWESKDAP